MDGLSTFSARLEGIKKADDERAAFLEEVIKAYDELKLKFDERTDDYNNEVASRRLWQSKASQSEQALAQHKQASASKNFVVALIDGDGAIFQDWLYSLGRGEGGAEAAHQLHTALQNHLKEIYPDQNVADWEIVAQVVLNLSGLAKKLHDSGIISNPNELHAFGRAFGLAQPLFSFVDVGNGKERADHKIRETLRLYLPIAQCKHVFFGPCSDNGYLPVLESYRRDLSMASRITLIETRPAEAGFVTLGLRRIKLDLVFRTDNLPSKTVPVFSPTPASTPARTPSASQASGAPLTQHVSKPASPAPSSDSTSSAAAASGSWASVGKNGAKSKTINIASDPKPKRRFILVNAHDERVDPELPKFDPGAEGRYTERVKAKGKCCNNLYLTGKCPAGKYCDYVHTEKLTPGEILVLKHKARSRSCQQKSWCEDVDCTFGHHCKFGRSCHLDYCYFSDTHGMDTQPAKRKFEDGGEEWLPQYLKGAA
ncbi:hypothetical protein M409DRAFT_69525 [Zasmidium cellare ATCC 36951]|uniref:C3H1-type domain-containing protein n=1 Tax=Zasmidium cellare ATCC 36951 TaxID=1080233 RepID=A0A6A6C3W4_ZASCE|nr:uncharacterized protein M409DRAFT_69525 [Zasmidium cellare ATCC 36951]KAF2161711.1 hypothetical protein M409DRAFT_69525 [Zasmidium cellare ATCC 36951]